jgi:hypothetical protein
MQFLSEKEFRASPTARRKRIAGVRIGPKITGVAATSAARLLPLTRQLFWPITSGVFLTSRQLGHRSSPTQATFEAT